jgi:hypothetical protein
MHKHSVSEAIKLARRMRYPRHKTDEAVRLFLEGIDTPRSLAVWILYRYGEHQQLVDLECDPNLYLDRFRFRSDYAATELLSKSDFLKLDVDRAKVALSKFDLAESRCHDTNVRFRNLSLDPSFKGPNVWLLNATRRKIESILSDFCPEEWFDCSSWGPGSTFHLGGKDTSSVKKFQCETGITRELHLLVDPLIDSAYPLWSEHIRKAGFNFSAGNKLTTVPKNAKTDRVIAIEPGLNVFFQLGIGKMISRRLLRSEGIDLSSQERNGLLAFYGSMAGNLATVDFSSASDLISKSVVEELLPPVWFSVLNSCRSMSYRGVDGNWHLAEKFSSMGNGFTFPLQSLIFTAAALSVCEYVGVSSDYVGVFGDDIVIPRDAYKPFAEFCDFLGFTVNPEKSFSTGLFRESCGTHYFGGLDVKPIYLKKALSDVSSLFRFANAIRRLAHRWCNSTSCDARFRKAWAYLFGCVPKQIRFRIPEGYGDGGFIDNFDISSPSIKRAKHWIEGFFVRCFTDIGVKRDSDDLGLHLDRLFNTSTRSMSDFDKFFLHVSRGVKPSRRLCEQFIDFTCTLVERTRGNAYTLRAITKKSITQFLVPR